MKWQDLPASIQRQIRAGKATTDERSQRGLTPPGPPQPRQPRTIRWKCHDCGLKFSAWQTAQSHGNEKGHVRIELILPGGGES